MAVFTLVVMAASSRYSPVLSRLDVDAQPSANSSSATAEKAEQRLSTLMTLSINEMARLTCGYFLCAWCAARDAQSVRQRTLCNKTAAACASAHSQRAQHLKSLTPPMVPSAQWRDGRRNSERAAGGDAAQGVSGARAGARSGRGQCATSERGCLSARACPQPCAAALRQPLYPFADEADRADGRLQPLPRGGGAPCALAADDAGSHALGHLPHDARIPLAH